jgi:hypothetical protein
LFEAFGEMSNHSKKAAVALAKYDIAALKTTFKDLNIIPQVLIHDSCGICTNRNNFAFKLIENVMTCLHQGGVPQYFVDYLLNYPKCKFRMT